jgi:hypothetical protein
MKGLIITTDELGKYHIHGPLSGEEAAKMTREACLVILLCDLQTTKDKKDQYNLFLECVANSKLRCRPEKQIKTMEYVIGTELSKLVSIQDFVESTIVFFDERKSVVDEIKQIEEV